MYYNPPHTHTHAPGNVMPDSYGENVSFTDSNAGKEGLCKHTSYVETIVSFIIPNNYNVKVMPYQDEYNFVQV